MSQHDQCHSTVTEEPRQTTPRSLQSLNGRPMWRSLDECADTPEFREFVEREFPSGAAFLEGETRRDFLKVMGASIALAGAATIPGCRRPDHKILSYSREVPEDVIPGRPLFYATSMALPGGGAEGLLVETHEGRPTKIEGNPLHAVNQGKSSLWSQSAILDLYDPDRLKSPVFKNAARGPLEATWEDFAAWADKHFPAYDEQRGRGLAFIVDKITSPTRDRVRDALLARWPEATWVPYSSVSNRGEAEGSRIAFGRAMRTNLDLSQASVIVSLGKDFLKSTSTGAGSGLVNARGYAARRNPDASHPDMSRLYVAETEVTGTGACADHRVRVAPAVLTAMAVELARNVLRRVADRPGVNDVLAGLPSLPAGLKLDEAWIEAAAEDLAEHGSHAVVLAGETLPAEAHALVHAINGALGSIGTVVTLTPMTSDEATDSLAALSDLAGRIRSGAISTIVCVDANPVYDAPSELDFASAYAGARATVCLSHGPTETGEASTWRLNGAHWLEAWGDTESVNGVVAPAQPMIAPLYGGWSGLELLGYLAGEALTKGWSQDAKAALSKAGRPEGYHIVRESWRASAGADFEKSWRRALHDGVRPGSTAQAAALPVDAAGVRAAWLSPGMARLESAPTEGSLAVAFRTSHVHDGRFANNGWLQELPDAGTRVVWDNPALVSPATARRLKLMPESEDKPDLIYTHQEPKAKLADLKVGGKTIRVPVWVLPGMADDTVLLTLGYGRRVCGLVGGDAGAPVGVDVGAVRPGSGAMSVTGATLTRASGEYPIASTQNHWSMEGRTSIVREMDIEFWEKHRAEFGDKPKTVTDPLYGTEKKLTIAEKMGELSHSPPLIGVYDNPLNRGPGDPNRANVNPKELDPRGNPTPPAFSERPQWGMSIDLGTCTGCGVCTVACQSENNIPIVGKKETGKGREMGWIRVDRYFVGDLDNPEQMVHQPVACVHCENAPCETVCPVNATVHGPEGINYMVYNRCIGTRYCANNCPYKVRRFNFFDYGVTKFNGEYYGQGLLPGGGPKNKNLIPPRLRKKLDEISRMQKNPDVTIRSRGVMEKCTYCIQRINAARVECKLSDIKGADGKTVVPDGFFQTACQQACPTGSIVFGDLLDTASAVHKAANSQRTYALLGFLNTRPRTSYRLNVRNPNRKHRLRPSHDPLEGHGGGHGGGGHDTGGHAPDPSSGAGETHGRGPAFFDRSKHAMDKGYALSLRVLSAGAPA